MFAVTQAIAFRQIENGLVALFWYTRDFRHLTAADVLARE